MRDQQIGMVVKDKMSGWRKVMSGILQGSVLAAVMFLIFINDMVDGTNSYGSLFADDAKMIIRGVETEEA